MGALGIRNHFFSQHHSRDAGVSAVPRPFPNRTYCKSWGDGGMGVGALGKRNPFFSTLASPADYIRPLNIDVLSVEPFQEVSVRKIFSQVANPQLQIVRDVGIKVNWRAAKMSGGGHRDEGLYCEIRKRPERSA